MPICRLLLLVAFLATSSFSAENRKTTHATRTPTAPVIDGELNDRVWSLAEPATDFHRYQPESGGQAPVKTEVKFLYDDVSLYISARMSDPDPASIPHQLGRRDDDNVHADWFGVWLNPFDDGTNELNFLVTSAGVQVDRKVSPEDQDDSWNPVWKTGIRMDTEGWTVEMAIPFSQMRFPAQTIQTWGLNMARHRDAIRETYTWSPLDKAKDNFAEQAGRLLGITNIESPMRLSFTPYASVSAESYPVEEGETVSSTSYRGGMDLQYGINESFTLDMTLIPDFGQVQSDQEVLNLSPFEIQHGEHRPFFTEGTRLLQRAGLFYSRRVGSRPSRYWDVADEEILGAGETVKHNPDATQLINATKITGQTINGIGLGLFNAITAPMHATIEDSLGEERKYLTNPLSNYNLIVVGKNLKNGSDISIVNTNVQRFPDEDESEFRNANVTGYETRLATTNSRYILESNGAYSALNYPDSTSTGYKVYVGAKENEGHVQYGGGINIESEVFNPNDMGYLRQPNEFSQYAWIEFKTIDPVWKVNQAELEFSGSYESLYKPRKYSRFNLHIDYNVTFKSYMSFGGGFFIQPVDAHDYYETRVEDRYYVIPPFMHGHTWVSTNRSKALYLSGWLGSSTRTINGTHWYGCGISPRWRVNNQLLINYEFDLDDISKDRGFAEFDDADNPVFGRRNQTTVTNSIRTQFILSPKLESDLKLRYYRSSVEYLEYMDLREDGSLIHRDYTAELSTVFNAFTIDAVVTWRFAPGSELNLIWKNAIYTEGDDPSISFFDDLQDLPSQDQSNNISVKLLYYLDYWGFRHKF